MQMTTFGCPVEPAGELETTGTWVLSPEIMTQSGVKHRPLDFFLKKNILPSLRATYQHHQLIKLPCFPEPQSW